MILKPQNRPTWPIIGIPVFMFCLSTASAEQILYTLVNVSLCVLCVSRSAVFTFTMAMMFALRTPNIGQTFANAKYESGGGRTQIETDREIAFKQTQPNVYSYNDDSISVQLKLKLDAAVCWNCSNNSKRFASLALQHRKSEHSNSENSVEYENENENASNGHNAMQQPYSINGMTQIIEF